MTRQEDQLKDMHIMLRGVPEATAIQAKEMIESAHRALVEVIGGLNKQNLIVNSTELSFTDARSQLAAIDRADGVARENAARTLGSRLEKIEVPQANVTNITDYLRSIVVGPHRAL